MTKAMLLLGPATAMVALLANHGLVEGHLVPFTPFQALGVLLDVTLMLVSVIVLIVGSQSER